MTFVRYLKITNSIQKIFYMPVASIKVSAPSFSFKSDCKMPVIYLQVIIQSRTNTKTEMPCTSVLFIFSFHIFYIGHIAVLVTLIKV